MKCMRRFLFFFLVIAGPLVATAQAGIPVIDSLDIAGVAPGTIQRYWLHLADNGFGAPVYVPVMVARGKTPGPVLGLVAAIHGNELNGIPIIQRLFAQLDPSTLRGTVVGVPGLNAVSLPLNERRFPDGEDLNRVFPGSATGNESDQYVRRIADRLIGPFQVMIDMHTASFGRVNSMYARADLRSDTLAELARLQGADIILNSRGPSVGNVEGETGTLRAEASLRGVASITVEYGNPQVYQPELIERGLTGVLRSMAYLGMSSSPASPAPEAVVCRTSYWIYTDVGGLLDVLPDVAQRVAQGEVIAVLRNPFGDVLREYRAPEDGIVIGKSSNPITPTGGRILQLGIPAGGR